MVLLTTKQAILLTFFDLIVYYKRTYCWPTRKTIQEIVKQKTTRSLSLSWIDDCLGWLKQDKYIKSYRNYGRRPDGTVYNKPSNRQLSRKALAALTKLGRKVPHHLWGIAKRIFQPPEAAIVSREELPPIKEEPPRKPGENPFLDQGHRRRLGLPDAPPFDPKKT